MVENLQVQYFVVGGGTHTPGVLEEIAKYSETTCHNV